MGGDATLIVKHVPVDVRGDRGKWPLWVAGAVGAIAYAIVFYPGAMSFDSAYQWWQARGGESTNIQGVGMTWLWRAGNALAPGPGAMFVLQLLLFWSGLALITQSRRLDAVARTVHAGYRDCARHVRAVFPRVERRDAHGGPDVRGRGHAAWA